MSKNPFELRAEILQMAKDYLDNQHRVNLEVSKKLFEVGQATAESFTDSMKMYTVTELTEKAKEMYSFVTTKE